MYLTPNYGYTRKLLNYLAQNRGSSGKSVSQGTYQELMDAATNQSNSELQTRMNAAENRRFNNANLNLSRERLEMEKDKNTANTYASIASPIMQLAGGSLLKDGKKSPVYELGSWLKGEAKGAYDTAKGNIIGKAVDTGLIDDSAIKNTANYAPDLTNSMDLDSASNIVADSMQGATSNIDMSDLLANTDWSNAANYGFDPSSLWGML